MSVSLLKEGNTVVSEALKIVVLDTPNGFKTIPNSDSWHSAFKSLMETGTKTVSGLNSTLSIMSFTNPFSPTSDVPERPINVIRSEFFTTHVFHDNVADFATQFFLDWISHRSLLSESNGASVLYYELDEKSGTIEDAWLITNMQPTVVGIDHSIEFTGLSHTGRDVLQLAHRVLNP